MENLIMRKNSKTITLISGILAFTLILSINPHSSAINESSHTVIGALYINDIAAPNGVQISLLFPNETLTSTTYSWDNGYNYAISFEDHDSQTGIFSVYYHETNFTPIDNLTVTIQTDIAEYHIDLHTILTINQPPYQPNNPHPTDGLVNVFVNEPLSWTGGDPDNDTVTYDVYFGASSPPPKVFNNQLLTTYHPGILSFSTHYYWQIIAWDS